MQVALLIYSGWFLQSWYGGGKGSMETSVVAPLDVSFGVLLDSEKQKLKCIAQSGCWYTTYEKDNKLDTACPPASVLDATKAGIDDLGATFNFAPQAAGISKLPEAPQPPAESAKKTCRYVEQGKTLDNACLYYSASPIDTLSIVWRGTDKGQDFGVALKTQLPQFDTAMAVGHFPHTSTLRPNCTLTGVQPRRKCCRRAARAQT